MKTQRWMAALIPDEKCGACLDKKTVMLMTNTAGYHPGLVMPSTTDGAPLIPAHSIRS